MAAGPITQLSDIIEPTVFTAYVQQLTEQKARLVQSGVLARNPLLDQLLAGGGLTFTIPSFRDLDDDADNVSGQSAADIQRLIATAGEISIGGPATIEDSRPLKIEADAEVGVRLNRNQSWSSADLAAQVAGADPMSAIGDRVAFYWARRLQAIFIATMNGVIADNTANDSGDYTNDVSGASYSAGVTDFSAAAFLDTAVTMGDSQEDLTMAMMHSVVYNRAQKNNLIDFIPDARGEVMIPTFLGREVVVDDSLPRTGSVYDTWLFGAGATQLGVGTPEVPTELERKGAAGNGGGQSVLHSRNEWLVHPTGHAYTGGTTAKGGPGNTELATAGAFDRVYPERKQIKFARLVTREA